MAITNLYADALVMQTALASASSAADAVYPPFYAGVSTAAAGNDSTNYGALPAGTANLYPTTAADDTKGVGINAADNVTGREIRIANGVSNKILKVYPPTGGTINGAAANVAFSSASGKGVIIICTDSTANAGAGSFAGF